MICQICVLKVIKVAITYGMDSVERIQKGEEYIGVA